jgi:hypothetical protein
MRARLVGREGTHYIRVSTEGITALKTRTSMLAASQKDKKINRAVSGNTQAKRKEDTRPEQNRTEQR